jgi:hypothetical protein
MSVVLSSPPIAVKYLNQLPEEEVPRPTVRSFCDALARVRNGGFPAGLLVTLETIDTCVWSPVALGLRGPSCYADGKVPLLFEERCAGVLVYNLHPGQTGPSAPTALQEPDAVIITEAREVIQSVVDSLGTDTLLRDYWDDLAFSANSLFAQEAAPLDEDGERKRARREKKIRVFNKLFGSRLFRSKPMMGLINRLMVRNGVQKLMTDICLYQTSGCSMCLSAATLPYKTGKANVVFSDAGSVTWGAISADAFTIGLPRHLYYQLAPHISIEPTAGEKSA